MTKLILLNVLLSGSLCFSAQARDDYQPQAFLQNLVDRSDLIVVATARTDGGGAIGGGPWPNAVTLTPRFDRFTPQLKIDRVLKGDLAADQLMWISYTVMNVGPKDPPKNMGNHFSFKVSDQTAKDEVGLPGAPRKGTQSIFFLENRKMRKPDSHEGGGKEEFIYQNFDYWFGMMPASEGMIFEIQELVKGR